MGKGSGAVKRAAPLAQAMAFSAKTLAETALPPPRTRLRIGWAAATVRRNL
jgi:hypothetical protein